MVNVLEQAQATENRIHSHPLKNSWEQIERQDEVARVLERIQWATRFDVYKCASLYDVAYPGYEGDKDYYLEKGKEGDVLYLGVGTGRVFADLAKKNPRAVGLDISPEMLDLLIKKNPLIRKDQVLEADALTADLEENRFDTVVAPYSFLQCVGDNENVTQLLKNIRRWLKPGGKFHTDTFSPYLIPFTKKGLESSVRSIDDRVRIAIYVLYDHFQQKMKELALIEQQGEQDRVLEMNLHYFFPHEMTALFKNAGLEGPVITGGYKGESFDPTENEIIVYEAMKKAAAVTGGNGVHRVNGNGNGHIHPRLAS
jgi:SAM-dependent methyltransferase